MKQVYIEFTEEPENLEETLGNFSAFEQNGNSTWMEKRSGDPKLRIDAYFLIPRFFPELSKENPYTIRISTEKEGSVAEERVNQLVERIKKHYSDIIRTDS